MSGDTSNKDREIPEYDYECTCWGCRLPAPLRDTFIGDSANLLHYFRYAVPPLIGLGMGRWYVFRDTPDNVIFDIAYSHKDFDDEDSRRVFEEVLSEIKLRARRVGVQE